MSREGLNFSFVQSDSASTLIADDVIQASRGVDLVVLMPPVDEAKGWIESDFAERVVMSSGRPVLLVPRGGEFKFGEAIIGWNASRESARAAFDAIPLLKYCDVARIVAVDPSSPGEVPGTELAEAFARHDIKAVTESYHTGGMEAGRAILQKGRDTGAALIVIGAYGHSRMRELILGGATREILTALDRPVLLSH
jgi:nucleotide-binding universal stress UspA family protein